MSFADGLVSSDGPEEFDSISPINVLAAGIDEDHGSEPGLRSQTHSRQSSLNRVFFSPTPSIGSSTSSVLGRRVRELNDPQAWSDRAKVHIRSFAADKCTEYELSSSERTTIMNDSEVSSI